MHTLITTSIAILITANLGLQAETVLLPPGGDIQGAINKLTSGDTIELQAGAYEPVNTIDTLGKAISIVGAVNEKGEPTSIIDGQGAIRVLQCMNNEGSGTLFKNLSITNGVSEKGGGMYCDYLCAPTLTNCTFIENAADKGGGLYIYWCSPTLNDCLFVNNWADEEGGGMFTEYRSNPALNNCAFVNNTSDVAGGLRNYYYCNPTLTNCIFTGNTALFAGGIGNLYDCSPTFIGCIIQNNSATSGGGLYNRHYVGDTLRPTLIDSIVCGNTTTQIIGEWIDSGGNTVTDVCPDVCPADVTNDGIVNGGDITFLFGYWGTSNPIADVNEDGIVNGADLTIMLDAWGLCG